MNFIGPHKMIDFSDTYTHYRSALLAYAMRFLPREEAEDVVQEMFSSLLAGKMQYKGKTELRNYMYLSVRNRCLDVLRHRAVVRSYIAEASMEIDSDTADEMFAGEIYTRLFQHIDALPDRQRETMLKVCEGKTNAEIAVAMNVGLETVKNQKYKALAALRKQMKDKVLLLAFFFTFFNSLASHFSIR